MKSNRKTILSSLLLSSTIVCGLGVAFTNNVNNTKHGQDRQIKQSSSEVLSKKYYLGNGNYSSVNFNNTFRNYYNPNFAVGVNRNDLQWTNYSLGLKQSGNYEFHGWFQQRTTGRGFTDNKQVDTDYDTAMSGFNTSDNNAFIIKKYNINEGQPVSAAIANNDLYQQNKEDNYSVGTVTNYDYINNTSLVTNPWPDYWQDYQFNDTLYTTGIDEGYSVSELIKIGAVNALNSSIQFTTDPWYDRHPYATTDNKPSITEATGLSQSATSKHIAIGLTYAKASDITPGVNVFSGTTEFFDDPIAWNGQSITSSITDADKQLGAAQWLDKNISSFDHTISIQMNNGYPGCLANATSFYANQSEGTVYAEFAPKTVLVNGFVQPYTGPVFKKALITGFNTSVAMPESSLSPVIQNVSINGSTTNINEGSNIKLDSTITMKDGQSIPNDGLTYQWYTCDLDGNNKVMIPNGQRSSVSFNANYDLNGKGVMLSIGYAGKTINSSIQKIDINRQIVNSVVINGIDGAIIEGNKVTLNSKCSPNFGTLNDSKIVYQWYLDNDPIQYAESSSYEYTASPADNGKKITLHVTYNGNVKVSNPITLEITSNGSTPSTPPSPEKPENHPESEDHSSSPTPTPPSSDKPLTPPNNGSSGSNPSPSKPSSGQNPAKPSNSNVSVDKGDWWNNLKWFGIDWWVYVASGAGLILLIVIISIIASVNKKKKAAKLVKNIKTPQSVKVNTSSAKQIGSISTIPTKSSVNTIPTFKK